MVSGTIGDGWLGLLAHWGEGEDPDGGLARRYRMPPPRLSIRDALRAYARAAADVSDGLLADLEALEWPPQVKAMRAVSSRVSAISTRCPGRTGAANLARGRMATGPNPKPSRAAAMR